MTNWSSAESALDGIEVWEAIRSAVLQNAPQVAPLLDATLAVDWRSALPRERAITALASILDLDISKPATRRQARTILQEFERSGLLDLGAPPSVREEVAADYSAIAEARRSKIARDLSYVASDGFAQELAKAPGPLAALDVVEKAALLKGKRATRFLHSLGFDIVILDKPRIRFLHRIGLVREVKDTQQHRREAVQVFNDLAQRAATRLREVSLILGVFCGVEGEFPGVAWCGTKPRCSECPLGDSCAFGRFEKERAAKRNERGNLADSMLVEDRPREKLAARGAEVLSNAELLAILLRTGTDKEHVVELSSRVLRTAGSLERLGRFSVQELTEIPGVGPAKAITIKAALELTRRISSARTTENPAITKARDVFEMLRGFYLDRKKELFIALLLNTKNRVIRQVLISEGTLNQSLVHPREAFSEALKDSAASIIFAHNHPSGDPTPSRDDKLITTRLVQAGDIVGVKVLDHIVVGADSYYSFADEGNLR